tara:strand:+ start:3503 stop:3631 length:129 start_codon:yes stop_codon:yes gene_type:complete
MIDWICAGFGFAIGKMVFGIITVAGFMAVAGIIMLIEKIRGK